MYHTAAAFTLPSHLGLFLEASRSAPQIVKSNNCTSFCPHVTIVWGFHAVLTQEGSGQSMILHISHSLSLSLSIKKKVIDLYIRAPPLLKKNNIARAVISYNYSVSICFKSHFIFTFKCPKDPGAYHVDSPACFMSFSTKATQPARKPCTAGPQGFFFFFFFLNGISFLSLGFSEKQKSWESVTETWRLWGWSEKWHWISLYGQKASCYGSLLWRRCYVHVVALLLFVCVWHVFEFHAQVENAFCKQQLCGWCTVMNECECWGGGKPHLGHHKTPNRNDHPDHCEILCHPQLQLNEPWSAQLYSITGPTREILENSLKH